MKIIRTANLIVLKTWLIGGQVDVMGSNSEGFHNLTKYQEEIEEEGQINFDKLKKSIINLIENYGNDPSENGTGFEFWDEIYRFKIPSNKNLNLLTKRVLKDLNEMKEWEKI